MRQVKKIGIIGLGNPFRRDDGIGVSLLDFLQHNKKEFKKKITIIDGGTGGMNLLHYLARFNVVLIIDAVSFGGKPGEARLFTSDQIQSKDPLITFSTHETDFLTVLSLSKELHELPKKLILFGIQPYDISIGAGLTEQLISCLEDLQIQLKKEIQSLIEETFPS